MLKPTGFNVLVKPVPVKKKSSGGIIIAHENEKMAQNAVQIGIVVAVGPDAWKGGEHTGEPWAKVGDLVYYPRYSAGSSEDPYTGEELMLLVDEDIKMLVSEGENPQFDVPEFEFIVPEDKLSEKQKREVLLEERRQEHLKRQESN